MLKLKNDIFQDITATPKEHYTFNFGGDELTPVEKKYINRLKIRGLIMYAYILILFVQGIFFREATIWFSLGMFCVWTVVYIGTIIGHKKMYEKRRASFSNTLYDYTLYDSFLIVWISSDDSIRQRKILLHEIKKARIIKNLVVLEIENELYLMRKNELDEGSYFLSICDQKKKRGFLK